MSMGPIPFTAIVDYARLYGIADFEDFLFAIRRMDDTIVKLHHDRESKRQDSLKIKGK